VPGNLDEQPSAHETSGNPTKWLNDKKLCVHLDVSPMSLWRLQNNPTLNFPKATKVNGLKRTNVGEVDAWMRERRPNDDAE
jgi:predicted DNA-binding transcriptional regulator AlpA